MPPDWLARRTARRVRPVLINPHVHHSARLMMHLGCRQTARLWEGQGPFQATLNNMCWQLVTVHPAEVAHVWRAPGVVQELPDGARKPILEPPSKASLSFERKQLKQAAAMAWRGLALPARGMPA